MNNFDVIILGAGPAGLSCALALRNSGLNVGVIEKETFPRNKTCGDAIPGLTLKYLRQIREESVADFEAFASKQRVVSSLFYSSGGKPVEIRWNLKAYNSKRFSFDNFLLEQVRKHSSTQVFEGVSVKDISYAPDGVLIQTKDGGSFSCKLLVGSDGANSQVYKSLSGRRQDLPMVVALRAYFEGVNAPRESNEFFYFRNVKGYFWIFPVEGNAFNAGIGILQPNAARSADLKGLFDELISHHPVIAPKFSNARQLSKTLGFRLPIGGEKAEVSGNRFLLTGDAAHLVDPIFGHGIDKAVKSGHLAAQQVNRSFKANDFSAGFLKNYDRELLSGPGRELRRNYTLMKLMARFPWLIDLSFYFLRTQKDLFLKTYYGRKKS